MDKEGTARLFGPPSPSMGRRALLVGCAALAAAPGLAAVAEESNSPVPTGLDANGHFRAVPLRLNGFSYARLREGVQFRVSGVSKNLIFYAPETVRVNATLGESYWTTASLVVTARPQAAPFAISETPTTLTIIGQKLRIEVDKASGALRFLDRPPPGGAGSDASLVLVGGVGSSLEAAGGAAEVYRH